MEQYYSPGKMQGSKWDMRILSVLLLASILVLGSACMTQQTAVPPATPTLVSRSPNENEVITFIQMINAQVGWALGKQAVLHTLDGGVHWRDITPQGLNSAVQDVQFPNATTAWIETITQADPPFSVEIFRTTDAGLHWQVTQGAVQGYGVDGPVQITFIDEQHGWLLLSASSASYSAQECVDVFRTVDGGKTWSHSARTDVIDPPSATRLPALGGFSSGLTFLTASTGWAAGHAPPGQTAYFYATHDGGFTWQRQPLSTGPYQTVGDLGGGLAVEPPLFFNAHDAVLLASGLSLPQAPHVLLNALYVTHDGGASWQVSNTVAGYDVSYADFLDVDHAWLIDRTMLRVDQDRTTLHMTEDGGQHWSTIQPQGVVQGTLEYISFVSPELGWGVERLGAQERNLVQTRDGGRTWKTIQYGIVE